MGLHPLLFHVDAGWNTDQAVGNIEKPVDGLGLGLYTGGGVNWQAVKRMAGFSARWNFVIRIWAGRVFFDSINLF